MNGDIFIISAPSGTGKTTVVKRVLTTVQNLTLAESFTTCAPRSNEAGAGDILFDIDPKGAAKLKQKYPDAVSIFLLPPSFDELKRRLKSRGDNTVKDTEKKIENAREEFSKRHEYDYQVVNEDLDEAVDEIVEIINYYRTDQLKI